MELNIMELLSIVLVSLLITISAYTLSVFMRKSRYNEKYNMAELEAIRSSLEKKIYELNERLLSSDKRWKDVNHLIIGNNSYKSESFEFNEQKPRLSNFLRSNGITEEDLILERNFVFVLTPFHSRFNEEFYTIKTICQNAGLKCLRGDETYINGDIFPIVLKYILKADFIIANIDGRNSNVLYELGIAQALDKNVILISKQPEDLPIDIQSRKFIIYKDLSELQEKLTSTLLQLALANR